MHRKAPNDKLTVERIKSMIICYRKLVAVKENGVQKYTHQYAINVAAKKHWYKAATCENYITVYAYLVDGNEQGSLNF